MTLFWVAADAGNLELVQALLEAGANVDRARQSVKIVIGTSQWRSVACSHVCRLSQK
jgi:hypothetical protein